MTNERDGFASAAVVRFVEALRNRDRELVVESVASAGTDSDVALDRWLKKAVRLRPQVDVNGWQIDDSWVVSTVELARLTLFTEPTALVRGAVRREGGMHYGEVARAVARRGSAWAQPYFDARFGRVGGGLSADWMKVADELGLDVSQWGAVARLDLRLLTSGRYVGEGVITMFTAAQRAGILRWKLQTPNALKRYELELCLREWSTAAVDGEQLPLRDQVDLLLAVLVRRDVPGSQRVAVALLRGLGERAVAHLESRCLLDLIAHADTQVVRWVVETTAPRLQGDPALAEVFAWAFVARPERVLRELALNTLQALDAR